MSSLRTRAFHARASSCSLIRGSAYSLVAVLSLSACGDDSTSEPPATGACCSADACLLVLATECVGESLFLGEGVECAPDPCPPSLSELPPDSGPNKGGALVLHYTPDLATTRDGVVGIQSCEDVVVTGPGDDGPVALHLFAVFPDEVSPEVSALAFGIHHTTEVSGWGHDLGFALTSLDWPSSGSGIALTVDPPGDGVIRDRVFPICWFTAYAYYGTSFGIGPHPDLGPPAFYDPSVPAVADSVWALGKVGFGSAEGRRPCSPCE